MEILGTFFVKFRQFLLLKKIEGCGYEKRILRTLFRITDCFFKNKINVKLNALIQNISKITIKFGKKLYDTKKKSISNNKKGENVRFLYYLINLYILLIF